MGQVPGRVDLQFDQNGVVLVGDGELGGKLIPVDSTVQEDTQAKDMLAPYKAELEELMKQVIGTAGVVLDGKRENVRSKETNLGNLIADGMLTKAKELKMLILPSPMVEVFAPQSMRAKSRWASAYGDAFRKYAVCYGRHRTATERRIGERNKRCQTGGSARKVPANRRDEIQMGS